MYPMLRGLAWVAGAFMLIVVVLLLGEFAGRQAKDPLDAPEFLALKARLAKEPRNEELKAEIRQADQQLRERYFRQRHFAELGGWLLGIAALILVVAAKGAAALKRQVSQPVPQATPPDVDELLGRRGRWAVGGLSLGLVALALALSVSMHSRLSVATEKKAGVPSDSPGSSPGSSPAVAAADFPSEEELAKQWPRFRGPGGLGISAYEDVPTQWNAAEGKNILWKTEVPLPGNSSPIVWGDRIFLSGADQQKRQVFCFDKGGQLLWQKEVPGTPQSTAEAPEVSNDTGYAASTMATDGRRVFAIFANGDLGAFDFSGTLVWSHSFGIPKSSYGYATSLLMHQRALLVLMDQGGEKDHLSKLMAFDGASGKTLWETPRDVPNSWPSPIAIPFQGKHQIITAASPWVIAYDPSDGKEIWRAKCLKQDVGPSPTFADGIVYTANEFPGVAAIRPDGQGDVTKTHVLWTGEDGLPDTASPLATAEYVLLLSSAGTLTCYEAKKGDVLWAQDFDGSFNSSPSLAGKYVYLFAKEGKCWVVEPTATEGKIVAESDLGEECVTSPAFQPGRFYIRGEAHLFCIGKP